MAETPEQSLCLSCGFCCDGTLFDYAPIEPGDELFPLLAAGNIITKQKTGDSFNMPCAAYSNGCCRIYNQSRPAICHNYSCLLLEKYESGNISFAEAGKKINRARELKESFKQELARIVPESCGMPFSELKKMLPETKAMLDDPVLLKSGVRQ